MTLMNHLAPIASPLVAATRQLDELIRDNTSKQPREGNLAFYFKKVAQLGAIWLAEKILRPATQSMWRDWSRLTDIELGFMMGARVVGD